MIVFVVIHETPKICALSNSDSTMLAAAVAFPLKQFVSQNVHPHQRGVSGADN
jgi:hypothetical protein